MGNSKNVSHVAVAVIFSHCCLDKVLIARRHEHLHQGGKWEFPGGKVEKNESAFSALKRECREELGIEIISAKPLCQIPFVYPEKEVLLDTWVVEQYQGEVFGREHQELSWVKLSELANYDFPEPNMKIIDKIKAASSVK